MAVVSEIRDLIVNVKVSKCSAIKLSFERVEAITQSRKFTVPLVDVDDERQVAARLVVLRKILPPTLASLTCDFCCCRKSK